MRTVRGRRAVLAAVPVIHRQIWQSGTTQSFAFQTTARAARAAPHNSMHHQSRNPRELRASASDAEGAEDALTIWLGAAAAQSNDESAIRGNF